ncbi:hypothetical protein [Devosia nitrariae]|nr:hypothetical protein [Devosia nitrariae]
MASHSFSTGSVGAAQTGSCSSNQPRPRMWSRNDPTLFIITGAMAAGKSTVAKARVQRFPRSAHVGGDAFLRMIVNGGAVMGPVLKAEARAQLTRRLQ